LVVSCECDVDDVDDVDENEIVYLCLFQPWFTRALLYL
jgi:hypothetical protein